MDKAHIALDSQMLSSLMSCARLTDFRFNLNLVQISGKSNSLEAGSIVHSFLESYYKSRIAGKSRNEAAALAHAFANEYIKIEVKNTPQKNEGTLIGWEWALDTCDQYIDYYRNDSWTPLEVEHVKADVIYEDDEIKILWKSKYDLICDTLQAILPVDHKTSKARKNTLSLNNQFLGQCVLLKSRNIIINKIGFQTTLKPNEKFERKMVSYSADRLIEWQTEIVPYWAKVYVSYQQNGYWPPNFTHCEKFGLCVFKDVCESNRSMRNEALRQEFMVGEQWDVHND